MWQVTDEISWKKKTETWINIQHYKQNTIIDKMIKCDKYIKKTIM